MKIFYSIVVLTFFPLLISAQSREIDSLQRLLKKNGNDSISIQYLNDISQIFMQSSGYDSAIVYGEKALFLAERSRFKKGIAKSCNSLGASHFMIGDYQKSLQYHLQCLNINKDLNYKPGIAAAYTNIADVYRAQGKYPEALRTNLEALKTYEHMNYTKGIVSAYIGIGKVYYYQSNYISALEYFSRGLKIAKEKGFKEQASTLYMEIGNVYLEEKKYDEALENELLAIKINKEIGNKSGQATGYNNIGVFYQKKNEYKLALESFKMSYKIMEEVGDRLGMDIALGNMADAYAKMNDYLNAEICGTKGLTIAREIGDLEGVKTINGILYDLFELKAKNSKGEQKAKFLEKALLFYKDFIGSRDSLVNEENTKRTVRLEMNYEFEKKENAAKLDQQRKDALAAADKKRQNIILLSISFFGILVLGFAIFAYRSFLQKKKANEEILKQKRVIEEKQKEIIDSIKYARRIQQSLLTSEKYVGKNLERLANNRT